MAKKTETVETHIPMNGKMICSCEDKHTLYVELSNGMRKVYFDGEYQGFYHPRLGKVLEA